MYKVVHKPWGKEEWLELNDAYCYKRIYINAGYKTSFQYHQFKKETNYIIDGIAEVWLENDEGVVEKKIMKRGEFFNVTPPKKHRVIAITDIILQEVSTPHVDDVFRIDDEFNRADGKIEAEHKTPAVLILSAGLGSRLKDLTKNINKAMIPINNMAIISYIVEKFPSNYDFILALGYKGEELKQYCQLAHPNINFTFVNVDKIEGAGSGPGYSAFKCKEYLQRPFYFIVSDCIIDSKMPHLDGNWLGVYPTSYPEKYSTVEIDQDSNILSLVNKDEQGYDNAFIGLASIWDYDIFWNELKDSNSGEIISAFKDFSKYPSFKSKELKWIDTGNLDDLNNAKEHFNDNPLSLYKATDEITYKCGKFIKFNPDTNFIKNKSKRAEILKSIVPSGYKNTSYFISYNWEPGMTLYSYDQYSLYSKFLEFYKNILSSSKKWKGSNTSELVYDFYVTKTNKRKNLFLDKFGSEYYTEQYTINGKKYDSMQSTIDNIDLSILKDTHFYNMFHGDLQFDNILYNDQNDKFTYIDWRESFADNIEGGDIYYDLAKLYGGCLIPYNLMKEKDPISLLEGSSTVEYSYYIPQDLNRFKITYEKWILDQGFDFNKVKLITGIIFLNMSPLHDRVFAKMLWFKSIQLLNDLNK